MIRRRRTTVAVVMAAAGTAAVVGLLAAPATAQAPDVAAWWSAANVGNGAPAVAPPDVPDGDLLVQGSNPNAAAPPLSPVTNAPATTQAVAGLIFDLPKGATVGALTLQIDGTPPPSVTIVACKATQHFAAEDNGAWSNVPPSDCGQTSSAKVDGDKLVFDDITKLVAGDRLAVTLIPGPVDRVVLKKPDDSALAVTTPGGFGTSAPPLGSGTNAGPVAAPAGSSGGGAVVPAAPVGGAAVLPPASTDTGAAAVAPPIVASGPVAGGGGQNLQQAAATSGSPGSGGLSTTQRRVLAFVVIGLELLGFALLMGDRGVEAAAAGSGAMSAVGGRLRAPDRVAIRTRDGGPNPVVAGVGRFRAQRHGPPPRL